METRGFVDTGSVSPVADNGEDPCPDVIVPTEAWPCLAASTACASSGVSGHSVRSAAMTMLEVRRHSMRKSTGGSQLSQAGVDLARRLGASMGPFAVVATSVVPRARETALAMGFAVDHELVTLASEPEVYAESNASKWWLADNPFAALASAIKAEGAYHRYAHSLAALWRDLITPLSNNDTALIIGHSGELEAALVACFPDADHSHWGGTFASCEGARLTFKDHFCAVEFLRLP